MRFPVLAAEVNPILAAGYASSEYALAFQEFGTVIGLRRCGGSILARPIPAESACDAIGPYPIFACRDWTLLAEDLAELEEQLVSVSLVTDCFAEVASANLRAAFPDVCYPYKEHFVTDLSQPLDRTVHKHHQRNIRKAASRMHVFQASPSGEILSVWQSLYDNLIERHGITGIARFSPQSFARQFDVPGFMAFAATDGDDILGMTLWYQAGSVAYYHLGAYSETGYELGASFAIFSTALSHFQAAGARWAALGAGAGTHATDSGLTRFKQGWATGTKTAYFCGRIMQPTVYARLARGTEPSTFFPSYRASR